MNKGGEKIWLKKKKNGERKSIELVIDVVVV